MIHLDGSTLLHPASLREVQRGQTFLMAFLMDLAATLLHNAGKLFGRQDLTRAAILHRNWFVSKPAFGLYHPAGKPANDSPN